MLRFQPKAIVSCTCVCLLGACQPPAAPDAHGDHAAHADNREAGLEPEPWRHTHFGAEQLLYLEHGPLIAGQRIRLAVHLSALASGAAVDRGAVRVELGPARYAVDGPASPGLFLTEGTLPESGQQDLRVFWEADGQRQIFELGPVPVYADEIEARRERPPAAPEPAGVAFSFEQQWLVGLQSAVAGPAELIERLRLPARLRLPESGEAEVRAPAAGRLVAENGVLWPASGQRVEAGQRLFSIEPALLPADQSQAAALELELELERLEAERRLAAARLAEGARDRPAAGAAGGRQDAPRGGSRDPGDRAGILGGLLSLR